MATAPGINYYNVGGVFTTVATGGAVPVTNIANIFTLTSTIVAPTTGNFLAFSGNAATAIYTVPASSVLDVLGFYFASGSAAGRTGIQFGYATATFTHDTASGSPPTGVVYYGSAGSTHTSAISAYNSGVHVPTWHGYKISFPAASFPFWRTSETANANSLAMICVLRAA